MELILIVAGAITTIAAAVGAIDKLIIKPIKDINLKLDKVDKISNGQKVIAKGLSQMMEHTISGNNIDELRKQYDNMRDFFIDN